MSQISQADRFYKMCTTLPYDESIDERDEKTVPELAILADLRDSGKVQEALGYGTALMKMYPTFDLIPFMLGYMLYQNHDLDKAFEICTAAIRRGCPRNYRLYSVSGLIEFERNKLEEAVVWWCRSVIAQAVVKDFQEYDPFLHLAHTAQIVGANEEELVLFTMTDAIEPQGPRLQGVYIARLRAMEDSWARPPLVKALDYIVNTHLN